MDSFIAFLREYKTLLISLITLVLTIVLIFIKRRPKTLEDFVLVLADVLNDLPSLINRAEIPSLNGISKKKEVRSEAISRIESKLGRHLSTREEDIAFVNIDKQIEDILSTPQKHLC